MPDPDPTAREFMDAPGTRVTPEPDEHSGHDRTRPVAGRRDSQPDQVSDDGTDATRAAPDDIAATEGGTGTSGSRGGGPAADFHDDD